MVEWKKLVSVSDVQYGYPFESSLFSEDPSYIPLIRIRDVKPAKASTYYSGDILNDYVIKMGDILVGMDGEFNLGKWNDRDGLLNQRVLKLSGRGGICLNGYLYHYMGPVFKQIEKQTPGGSVKHLSAKIIKDIIIPVPSIEEQKRIVGILDTFTSSIENLKQQIVQRRKQYEHYRDQLFDFEGINDAEMKKLGDISTFSQGIQVPLPEQSLVKKDGYSRFLRIVDYTQGNEPPRYVPITDKRYWISKEEIAIVRYGTPGYVCYGFEGILANNLFKVNIKDKTVLTCPYLIFVLKSKVFQSAIKQKSSGGALQAISFGLIRDILVPIPSLEEQSRIVSALNTFEASIVNLEAQLKEREKQYEYYRNKLLTFD